MSLPNDSVNKHSAASPRIFCILMAVLAFSFCVPALAQDDEGASRATALEKIKSLYARLELAPRDSYLNYAIATIARMHDIDLKKEDIAFPIVPVVTDDPARRVDLFSLGTGLLALHESLQLSELINPRDSDVKREIAMSELDPPRLPSLPYEEMIKGHKIDVNEEAGFVPDDWAYLRFTSGDELLSFALEADRWIRHLIVFYGNEAREKEMVLQQFEHLGLPDPRALPALYKALPGPITITMSDLFLREGTDVTVILPAAVPALFFGESKGKAEEISEEQRPYKRHAANVNGRVVLSTSRTALDKVVSLAEKAADTQPPEGTLAACADFLHMRSLLPASADESGFIYLSDAFLRRLVGPRLRIKESRRVRCASHLRTIVNAGQLFTEERGARPATVDELVEKGYLEELTLRCPHSGAYSLDEGSVPSCSVHGCLGFGRLTPNIDLSMDKADENEAWAYRRFSRAYTNFWRRYFDPVGISIKRNDEDFEIDVMVLPLAQGSLYRNLASFAGGAPIESGAGPVHPDTVFLASTKVDRAFVNDLNSWIFRSKLVTKKELRSALLEGFDEQVMLGLLDGKMLFDFDLSEFMGNAVRWNLSEDILLAPLFGAANLPAYACVPIRDIKKAKAFLDALEKGLIVKANRPEGGSFSIKVGAYDLAPKAAVGDKGHRFKAMTIELFSFKFRLFYVIHDNVLIAATRPDILCRVMDEAKPNTYATPYNIMLSLFPGRWNKVGPDMYLGYEEAARVSCLKTVAALWPFREMDTTSASRLLGIDIECPDCGNYSINAEGEPCCSIHGTPAKPAQTEKPSKENPTSVLFDSIEKITFSLRFTEEGIHTSILVRR